MTLARSGKREGLALGWSRSFPLGSNGWSTTKSAGALKWRRSWIVGVSMSAKRGSTKSWSRSRPRNQSRFRRSGLVRKLLSGFDGRSTRNGFWHEIPSVSCRLRAPSARNFGSDSSICYPPIPSQCGWIQLGRVLRQERNGECPVSIAMTVSKVEIQNPHLGWHGYDVATKTHCFVCDSLGSSPPGSFIALATVDTQVPHERIPAPIPIAIAGPGTSPSWEIANTIKAAPKVHNPAPRSVADLLLSGLFMLLMRLDSPL